MPTVDYSKFNPQAETETRSYGGVHYQGFKNPAFMATVFGAVPVKLATQYPYVPASFPSKLSPDTVVFADGPMTLAPWRQSQLSAGKGILFYFEDGAATDGASLGCFIPTTSFEDVKTLLTYPGDAYVLDEPSAGWGGQPVLPPPGINKPVRPGSNGKPDYVMAGGIALAIIVGVMAYGAWSKDKGKDEGLGGL